MPNNSSNSFLTFNNKEVLSSLTSSGFLEPPINNVNAALDSSVRSEKITELHNAPRKDLFSFAGIKNPKPSKSCLIDFLSYTR